MRPAAERAGVAMRKLAQAASSHVGSDCYVHAAIGRELLKDLGIKTELKAGHAAWRIGSGDGDVMSHVDGVQGYLPEGAQGFAYHVWLETVEEGGASPMRPTAAPPRWTGAPICWFCAQRIFVATVKWPWRQALVCRSTNPFQGCSSAWPRPQISILRIWLSPRSSWLLPGSM